MWAIIRMAIQTKPLIINFLQYPQRLNPRKLRQVHPVIIQHLPEYFHPLMAFKLKCLHVVEIHAHQNGKSSIN